jgi:hypothetical protein
MEKYKDEIEYLSKIINIEMLTVNELHMAGLGKNKVVAGLILGSSMDQTNANKYFQMITWIKNANYLIWGIRLSLNKAISLSYDENNLESFSIVSPSYDENEKLIYYYIENSINRIVALWDCMYQYINVREDLEIDFTKVSYYKIRDHIKELKHYHELIKYKEEVDNTDSEGRWEGNNLYVYDLRNKINHRFSITNPVFSSQNLSLKDHPRYILKRICEDFSYLHTFFKDLTELDMNV